MAHALGHLIRFRPVARRVSAGTNFVRHLFLGFLACLSAAAQPGASYPLVRFTVFAVKAPADLAFVPTPGAAPKLAFGGGAGLITVQSAPVRAVRGPSPNAPSPPAVLLFDEPCDCLSPSNPAREPT